MKRNLFSASLIFSVLMIHAQKGNVGINTSTPQTALDVNGNARVQQLPAAAGTINYGGTSATFNPVNTVVADANGVLGIVAGTPAASSSNFWSLTGNAGTTAGTNFLGTTDAQGLMFKVNSVAAGFISTATGLNSAGNNVSLGVNAAPWMLNATSNSKNVAIGSYAMYSTPTSAVVQNVAVGQAALANFVSGGTNTAVGPSAMGSATQGGSNVAIGIKALNQLSSSDNFGNVGIGYLAGAQMTGGRNNILIGNQTVSSGLNATGDNNIYIGQNAGQGSTTGKHNIAIGTGFNSNTLANADSQLNIGNTIFGSGVDTASGTNGKIGISTGNTNPNSTLQVGGSVSAPLNTPNSGNYNLTDKDYTIRVYNGAGTITLPDAATCKGRIYVIIGSNGITAKPLATTSSQDVYDDVTNSHITNITAGVRYTLQSDGANWIVIGR